MKKGSGKVGICLGCKLNNRIEAKGFCKKCYGLERYKNNKNEWKEYNAKNAANISVKNKNYRDKNKAYFIEYDKKYRIDNKEKKTIYMKKYHKENEQEILQYRIKNKDKIYEYFKNYLKTPRGKFLSNLRVRERQNKLKNIKHGFTQKEWEHKIELTNGFCPMCFNEFQNTHKRRLTMDHEPALSEVEVGYTYNINDVNPICQSCNSSKRTKHVKIDFTEFLNKIEAT